MKAKELWNKITTFADRNAPAVLTGFTMVGAVLTAVTAARAGIKIKSALDEYHQTKEKFESDKTLPDTYLEDAQKKCIKDVTLAAIPMIIATGGTMVSAFGSNKVSSKRLKMVSAAYAMSQASLETVMNNFDHYKETVADMVGKDKNHKIKNEDMRRRGDSVELPPDDKIIVTGHGDVPCVDLWHDKRIIFYSSQAEVERAINTISARCFQEQYVTVADLYYELGLRNIPTSLANEGWSESALIEGNLPITVTTFLHHSGVPCLALDYEPEPFFKEGGRFRNSRR